MADRRAHPCLPGCRLQVDHQISNLAKFIARHDPTDIRMGAHLYNPHLDTAVDVELRLSRTAGTSHRTVSVIVYTFKVGGFDDDYYLWGCGSSAAWLLRTAAHPFYARFIFKKR